MKIEISEGLEIEDWRLEAVTYGRRTDSGGGGEKKERDDDETAQKC